MLFRSISNLEREGVDPARVHLVGNVMIDTLLAHRAAAAGSDVVARLGVRAGDYAVLTLHRPANVDAPPTLRGILEPLSDLSRRMPIVFPVHPRTREALSAHASLLSPELEDKLATGIALFVVFIVPVVLIVLFWMVHILPEKIAHQRNHPQFEAIRTLCLLSLVFGGLLWPIAWVWAYSKPVMYKMAYGTDEVDHSGEPE